MKDNDDDDDDSMSTISITKRSNDDDDDDSMSSISNRRSMFDDDDDDSSMSTSSNQRRSNSSSSSSSSDEYRRRSNDDDDDDSMSSSISNTRRSSDEQYVDDDDNNEMNDNDDGDDDTMSNNSSTRRSNSSSSSSSDDYDYYDDDDDDDDDFSMVRRHIFGPALPPPPDHRTLPRGTRKVYDHLGALACIERDYIGRIGLVPIFDGKEFDAMFRISRSRFQRLRNEIGALEPAFYVHLPQGANGMIGASLDARLLLPIKTLAFGVPPHAFRDYFQMSKTFARDCCENFNKIIIKIYKKEYMRLPTPADVKAIFKLHKHQHKINGMGGSLDCMHTYWKNCPVAWQGNFAEKEKRPSIVLEAACDYHLWFWHTSYGYAGTLNDINIMNLSHLQEGFLNGTFAEIESKSGIMPYIISDEKFWYIFYLVDGIYPRYSRFVKAVKQPILPEEGQMTKFQEAARKDIERAFGVFQIMWQCAARPILLMDQQKISEMINCVLILHNMCVSDRVMGGDVYATYDPTNTFESPEGRAGGNGTVRTRRNYAREEHEDDIPPTGIVNLPNHIQQIMANALAIFRTALNSLLIKFRLSDDTYRLSPRN